MEQAPITETSGAKADSPVDLLSLISSFAGLGIPVIGGILGSIFGSQETDKEKRIKALMKKLEDFIPQIEKAGYSKSELEGKFSAIANMFGGAADVAAGRVGSATGESLSAAGVPKGQAFTSYYTQDVAPIIAEGQKNKAATLETGTQFVQSSEMSKIAAIMQTLGLEGELVGQTPDTSAGQRSFLGALGGMDIGASALGNIGKFIEAINKKYPDLLGNAGKV